jgi:hypothetical protein
MKTLECVAMLSIVGCLVTGGCDRKSTSNEPRGQHRIKQNLEVRQALELEHMRLAHAIELVITLIDGNAQLNNGKLSVVVALTNSYFDRTEGKYLDFTDPALSRLPRVSVAFTNSTYEEILNALTQMAGLHFRVQDSQIVIMDKDGRVLNRGQRSQGGSRCANPDDSK